MEHSFDKLEDEFKDSAFEEKGIVIIDTRIWKRPSGACEYFKKEKGFEISAALMNFWKNKDWIDNIHIDSLNLTLVDITSLRKDIIARLEVKRDED